MLDLDERGPALLDDHGSSAREVATARQAGPHGRCEVDESRALESHERLMQRLVTHTVLARQLACRRVGMVGERPQGGVPGSVQSVRTQDWLTDGAYLTAKGGCS